MNLLLHSDYENDGLLILEMESQYRTILVNSNTRVSRRVPFPNTIFVLRYEKVVRYANRSIKRFRYGGLYTCGLRIFGSEKPLESMQDEVFLLPCETQRKGLVCTDHRMDGAEFDTLTEFVSAVINCWFGLTQVIEYSPWQSRIYISKNWWECSLEDLKKAQWMNFSSFIQACRCSGFVSVSPYGSKNYTFKGNEILKREQWPPEKLYFLENFLD